MTVHGECRVVETGSVSAWNQFAFSLPGLPAKAKRFLKDELGLVGMEVSLNSMAAGENMPFLHRHRKNEELYLFLSGHGEFQADEEIIPIIEGTCIRCSPQVKRSWRNTGDTELRYIVIQAPNTSMPTSTVHDGELVHEPPMWA